MIELVNTLEVANTLGEAVLWDDNNLWWTDIQGKKLYRWNLRSAQPEIIQLPYRLGSFGLTSRTDTLIVAFDIGFALFNTKSKNIRWLGQPNEVGNGTGRRLNDGRVDRQGRFWCGAMVENTALCNTMSASLYCLSANGGITVMGNRSAIFNGICWSPDGKRMYFADSAKRTIWRYKFNATDGRISKPHIFATTPSGVCPDGAVTDTKGGLWSAHWGAGQVVRYSTNGVVDQIIEVPARQPSCVAFGGTDMKTLFVTSAQENLDSALLRKDNQAGHLFVYHTDITGIREPRYNPKFLGKF